MLEESTAPCLIGLLIVGQAAEAAIQEVLGRGCVPHVIAQAVGQLEVLIIGDAALDAPHLLKGLGESREEGLQVRLKRNF